MNSVKNVVVVIGTGGMGKAIIRRIGAGSKVVVADVDEGQLNKLADTFRDDAFDVVPHGVDVSNPHSVRQLAVDCAALGPVMAVVHTAGVSPLQASIQMILAVDLVGTALVIDAFQEVIAPGGSGVFIASMAGQMATVSTELQGLLACTPTSKLMDLPQLAISEFKHGHQAYDVAKRGNQLRVQASAVAWGSRGARINSISPGIISTPMSKAEFAGGAIVEAMRRMIAASPAKRVGTSEEIAAAVAFLVGPDSTYITGTDLLVDGGVVASYKDGLLI